MSISKQAVQQILDGNTIAVFDSRHAAANASGVDISSIRKVCRGVRKIAGGFKWLNTNISDHSSIGISQRNKDGILCGLYSTVAIASKATGIKAGNIRYALHGKRGTAGGFVWA